MAQGQGHILTTQGQKLQGYGHTLEAKAKKLGLKARAKATSLVLAPMLFSAHDHREILPVLKIELH